MHARFVVSKKCQELIENMSAGGGQKIYNTNLIYKNEKNKNIKYIVQAHK